VRAKSSGSSSFAVSSTSLVHAGAALAAGSATVWLYSLQPAARRARMAYPASWMASNAVRAAWKRVRATAQSRASYATSPAS
jgi:hypothetical protein